MKKSSITIMAITAVAFAAVFVFHKKFTQENVGENFLANPQVKTSSTFTGLIVPHFDPVSYMTVDALDQVHIKPDLIILIGPNHHEAGVGRIITGKYISPKLRESVAFDETTMQALVQMHAATREDTILSGDHSIGTPLPFLVHKFPGVKVLPIILKYHQQQEDIDRLVTALQKISSGNILIVASIDFSHYLSSDIAPLKDAETEKYIAAHDYKHIASLNNDYIDSPWSLITFLKYLDVSGVHEGRQLAHTNTGLIAGQTIESSTSFFTYIFK